MTHGWGGCRGDRSQGHMRARLGSGQGRQEGPWKGGRDQGQGQSREEGSNKGRWGREKEAKGEEARKDMWATVATVTTFQGLAIASNCGGPLKCVSTLDLKTVLWVRFFHHVLSVDQKTP